MKALRAVLANRDLVLLESAWASVSLVRWAQGILVALYAYAEAGATGVGVAALVRMLPATLLAPRLSVLADHHSRRLVLLASLVARTVLAAALTGVVWMDAPLAAVLTAAAAYGVADCLQRPTQAALLGVHARTPGELAAANSLWSMLDNLGFVVGAVLVGVLLTIGGPSGGFFACLLPLLVAVAAAAHLTPDVPPPPLPQEVGQDRPWEGGATIARDPQLRLLVGILGADMFVQAMLDVLLVIAALALLDMGEQGAGWLSTAWGIGGVVGGAVAAFLLARRRLAAGLIAGPVVSGLPLVAVGLFPDAALALVAMALVGLGFGMLEVMLLTLTQRLVAADMLGRVYGMQETVTAIAMALGSVAAAGIVGLAGAAGALIVVGALLPLLAISVRRRIRLLGRGDDIPEEVFRRLRSVPAFSTLPMVTVENLALRAKEQHVDAARDVVRQGEPGSAFYVIADGTVRVTEDGELRRLEHEGDFFGEIALMHRIPRTATVTAMVPTRLLVIDQDEFLAAVGAHPRTQHVLQEVASDRLSSPEAS